MAFFLLAYVTLVLWSASTVALDVIDERLLAPVFPVAVLVGAMGADRALAAWSGRGIALPWMLRGAYGLWFVLGVPATAEILGAGGAGQGYRSPGWRNSEIVTYLREAPPTGSVHSNDAPGVYLETGLPAQWGPRRHVYASPQTIPDDITPLLQERARGARVTLVWFDYAPPYFMSRDEVAAALDMDTVAVRTGGIVFRLR